MPLITVILFFVFVGLLFLLSSVVRNRKKLKQADAYGRAQFEIDLPAGVKIDNNTDNDIPPFSTLSDAESFYTLITPYIGSLTKHKRDFLFQHLNDLKNDLKMNKDIYQKFVQEYDVYKSLSDKAAAEKWAE